MKRAYKIQEFVAHTGNVNCVKIGKRTSRVLVTGGEDHKVNMWAVGKPNPILSLSGHSSAVESVTFDVTEVLVVAGAASGTVKLWDLEEARIVRTLTGHRSNCTALDFHPFGEFFASGSLDTNLKVWDVRRKGCIHTYKGHTKGVNCVKFSPDGRWVVSGGEDNLVKLWDLTAGKLMHEFKHHDGQVQCLDFHPQEFLLATGSTDRTVKFVDLETFASIGCAGPETTGVRSVTFHPDGQTLLYGLHESLKVYSWEPLRCHDVVEVGWSKLADLSISEGKLLGCSYNQSCVGVWVVDLAHVAPHGMSFARGFGSPRSSFSFRSPKLITNRDLQLVGEGITRLSIDREPAVEQVKGAVSTKGNPGRDHPSNHANDGTTRLNPARDHRSQQVDVGNAKSSMSRDQVGEPETVGRKSLSISRDHHAQQVNDGPSKSRGHLLDQDSDGGSKLNTNRDVLALQVGGGSETTSISGNHPNKQSNEGGEKANSGQEFVVEQVRDEGDNSSTSGDCPSKLLDEGAHNLSQEFVVQQVNEVNKHNSKDHGAHHVEEGRKLDRGSRDNEVQQLSDVGNQLNCIADQTVHHPKEGSLRDGLAPNTSCGGARSVMVSDSLGEQGLGKGANSREHIPSEAGTRLSSHREDPFQQPVDGGKVSTIKQLLYPDSGMRLGSSRDFPVQHASDVVSKVSTIREQLFSEAGTRPNSNRDHLVQKANDRGSKVSSIREQLFPDAGTRLNNHRDHSVQQSNDGASKGSTIRDHSVLESGNRLNSRDHLPHHHPSNDGARKPVDIVVKRPIAFEVMNSSPRMLQMDVKPSTPTRGIVKVEDHSFLIGGARAALTKGSIFQNGMKNFGHDGDSFVAKGSRLERTNSGENGLKPLGLDMNAFAPKGSLSDRADSAGNDLDLIKELMQQHQTVSNILLARLTNMQVVQRFLSKDDLKGAVEALGKVADPSVLIDVVNVLMGKCDAFTLEICSMLLPSINQLLTSDYEKYLTTGIALLSMLVKNFGQIIRATRTAPPAVGVDLEAERRLECCNVCYEKLQMVRQSLVPLTKRGGSLAKAAHDLSTTLDEI